MEDMKEAPFSLVVATGSVTVLLASALAYVLMKTTKRPSPEESEKEVVDDTPLVIDKTEYPGGQIIVLYATQTGTAESFARQLEREGPEHGFFVHVVDLEDIQVEDLVDESKSDPDSGTARAIFLAATYGEGEAPDNATMFVNAMAEKGGTEILFESKSSPDLTAPESCLVGLDYGVFGLGNKQYDHYNAMGKFFDHAIGRLGGNRVVPLGLGDDDSDLEGDFENWKDNVLWPTLKKRYLADASVLANRKPTTQSLPDCPFEIVYHTGNGTKAESIPLAQVHASSRHYFTAVDCPVKLVRELRTPQDLGSTVHVEIDISNANDLTYQTADNLGVLPRNDLRVVESVAESLGYDLDRVFSVKAAADQEWHGAPFPMPLTIRECLTRYLDLTSAPLRSELKLLANYAKDPTDQNALIRMASKEGRAEYREKILDDYVGLVDLLKRCPSIEIPLEHLINVCSLMQTRFFTISSSSSVHPNTVHLTVSVTQANRKDGSIFKGVCSNYLAEQRESSLVRVFNRPSSFRLPSDPSKPILMIGPGTGVAPMRALLQERAYQRQSLQPVGKNILYFGCKSAKQDFIYEDELRAFEKTGDLHELHVAFSREQKEKVYVQHLLLQNAAATWGLIDGEGAHIYVCGGVKMGHDVLEALRSIATQQGSLSPSAAKDYLAALTKEGRLVQELWA